MKKLIFLFVLIFVATACATKPTTTFKNPIFNEKMTALSRDQTLLKITPTTIVDESNNLTDFCELLENNETSIFMKCTQNDQNSKYKDVTYYVQYKSVGPDYFDRSDCIIQENMFEMIEKTDKSFKGYARFSIPRSHLKNNDCGPIAQNPILHQLWEKEQDLPITPKDTLF